MMTFNNIIELAVRERVNAVVISGDIYNSEDHNLEAQVRFVRAMYQLWGGPIFPYIWCKVIMILLKAGALA